MKVCFIMLRPFLGPFNINFVDFTFFFFVSLPLCSIERLFSTFNQVIFFLLIFGKDHNRFALPDATFRLFYSIERFKWNTMKRKKIDLHITQLFRK